MAGEYVQIHKRWKHVYTNIYILSKLCYMHLHAWDRMLCVPTKSCSFQFMHV